MATAAAQQPGCVGTKPRESEGASRSDSGEIGEAAPARLIREAWGETVDSSGAAN